MKKNKFILAGLAISMLSGLGLSGCSSSNSKWNFEVAYNEAVKSGYKGSYDDYMALMLGKAIIDIDVRYEFDKNGNQKVIYVYHYTDGTTSESSSYIKERPEEIRIGLSNYSDPYVAYSIELNNGKIEFSKDIPLVIHEKNGDTRVIPLTVDMLDLTDINLNKPGIYNVGVSCEGCRTNILLKVGSNEEQTDWIRYVSLVTIGGSRVWTYGGEPCTAQVDVSGLLWKVVYRDYSAETFPVELSDFEDEIVNGRISFDPTRRNHYYLSRQFGDYRAQGSIPVDPLPIEPNLSLDAPRDKDGYSINYSLVDDKVVIDQFSKDDFETIYIPVNCNGCTHSVVEITKDLLEKIDDTTYQLNIEKLREKYAGSNFLDLLDFDLLIHFFAIPEDSIKYYDTSNRYYYFDNGRRLFAENYMDYYRNFAYVSEPWYHYTVLSQEQNIIGISSFYCGMDYYCAYDANGTFVEYHTCKDGDYDFTIAGIKWGEGTYNIKVFDDHYLELYSTYDRELLEVIYIDLIDPVNNIYQVGNTQWKKTDDFAEPLRGNLVFTKTMTIQGKTYACKFYDNNIVAISIDGAEEISVKYFYSSDKTHLYIGIGYHTYFNFLVNGSEFTFMGETKNI